MPDPNPGPDASVVRDLKAEAIERMAREVTLRQIGCSAAGAVPGSAVAVYGDKNWQRHATDMEAALTALLALLAERGWAIVPREATSHQYEGMKVLVECCLSAAGKIDLALTYATGIQAAPSPFPQEADDAG